MAVPMLAGTFAMNTYNFVDTWFVSKLGTVPLAAMGFTFPVVMLLRFIVSGIGTGVTTLTSHALGRRDRDGASRFVTHGMILIFMLSAILAVLGSLTIVPLFRRLGADETTLPYVATYMRIWYFGALFMAAPMMGNGILISLNDSKTAGRVMMIGPVLNCILDPIFIFGLFGLPALGIFGAALATILAQAVQSVILFRILVSKYRMLVFRGFRFPDFGTSCVRIMDFAIPGSLSMMLMPISAGIITALVSRHGTAAVAAISAAGRIEMLAFVIPMALGMSLTPFVSQNYGAGRMHRIYDAKKYSTRFAFFYGAFISVVFFIAAPVMAAIFTKDPRVEEIFILYVRTISFGYGMMEIHRYSGFFLTGIHRPMLATAVNAVRVVALLIPLSFLGNKLYGILGIFGGRLLTDIAAGCIGLLWVTRLLGNMKEIEPGTDGIRINGAGDGEGEISTCRRSTSEE